MTSYNKFGNIKTTVEGKRFDSKLEARRYQELVLLERAGEIEALRLQVPYKLIVNGNHVCTYRADFVYTNAETGCEVVEDAKGVETAEFRIKAKLMLACNGLEVRCIYAAGRVRNPWRLPNSARGNE